MNGSKENWKAWIWDIINILTVLLLIVGVWLFIWLNNAIPILIAFFLLMITGFRSDDDGKGSADIG